MNQIDEVQESSNRDKISNLCPIEDDYQGIDLDHLLVYVMSYLDKKGILLSEPNISVSSWKMFPQKFSIFGWSEYPDSTRVHTCLWHLKDKGKRWITGTPSQFIITEKGLKESDVTSTLLKRPITNKSYSKTRKQEKILEQVKKTKAYLKYLSGDQISNFDLYDLLQCTLDSSKKVLKENYDSLLVLAKESDSEDMITFLRKIKENFEEIKNG